MKVKLMIFLTAGVVTAPTVTAAGAGLVRNGQVVLFEDSFADNRHDWVVGTRKHSRLEVSNGRYLFEHLRSSNNDWMTWRTVRTHHDRNFRIVARIRKLSGAVNGGYGIIFGASGTKAFKSFLIRGDGKYQFTERTESGGKKTIIRWRSSSAIRRGNRATNTLAVQQDGKDLKLYVNGLFVNSVRFTPFSGHKMGFQVWRKQKIAIQHFKVVEYGPPPSPRLSGSTTKKTLLDERFDDNLGGWATADDQDKRLDIRNGYYEFTHKRNKSDWLTWKAVGLKAHRDFRVEATIRKISGIQDHGYGIVFGLKDAKSFFSFVVSGDGHYRYGEKRSGKFTSITGWATSNVVRRGDGATNRLAVQRQGSTLFLFINGQLIDRVPAKRLLGTRVGLQINRKQTIHADDLTVYEYRPGLGLRPPRTASAENRKRPVSPPAPSYTPAPPSPPPPAAAPPPTTPLTTPARPPFPSGRPYIVAVFELEDGSGQLKKDVRTQLTEYLSVLLAQKGRYSVVPMAQVRDRLRETKAESYKDCYDESCQIEIGKAVAAQGVITTKLLKIGGACALTSKLFDLRSEASVRAAAADTNCDTSALLGAMRTIAQRL